MSFKDEQRRAWLLLGWVTAERSCPCKQPACPATGGGSEVTSKLFVPTPSLSEKTVRCDVDDGILNDCEVVNDIITDSKLITFSVCRVGAGWSVKTQHNQTYKQQPEALDEAEKQIILEVIQRADALDSLEQERVGGKHGNLKLKHGSSDTSFERAHLVELNAANRISKGLSNQKWRNTTIQSEMAAHNVLHNVYLKQPAISDWINLLRCGLRHSTLLSELFQMSEVRTKKPSLTLNLGTKGLEVTSEPPPMVGQTGSKIVVQAFIQGVPRVTQQTFQVVSSHQNNEKSSYKHFSGNGLLASYG
ncbi:hypothetical protein J6590_043661 [Homalodisca vitripennis]|nr:hypothetical protein J6590_043661 [Homalodisca vitripennis]